MKCFWMALLLEMIALVQKNWVPQRAGLEDRVFKKLPQAGVLVLNTCYPGPLFLASDVTCRKQIKERHFFSCVLKKSWASGLKVSHWLLCHWCEEHTFLIPTPERYLCSDWTLLCTSHSQTFKKRPCCSTRPAALMSDRTCGSHQHMPIANPLYYKCIPWSEGMLCRILLRGSNTCKPPNTNADWRLMVRNMCQFQSRGTAAPSRVKKVQCHQLATK